MAYDRVNWINEEEGTTTPLNAENLNQMDEGIADIDERVTALEEAPAPTTDAFSTVKVGEVEIEAEGADTFTLKAGNNVTLTADPDTKEITIESQGGGGGGGHEMISGSVDDVTNNTTPNKVVDAILVKEYSNRYTERVVLTLKAGTNTIGTWQETDRENWVKDEAHFITLPQFYEGDDEDLEINILFDTINCEPVFLYGWQWVNDMGITKGGKPCGGLCIRSGNEPSEDTRVFVDITRVRYDNVVVVPTT